MKKAIICLGMAVLSFTNVALAAGNGNGITNTEISRKYEVSPLCMAISKGDTEVVKKFIEYGANVNETTNGMTPLMVAARYNRIDIIQLLLQKGADLYARDNNGHDAKYYAEISKSKEAYDLLRASK